MLVALVQSEGGEARLRHLGSGQKGLDASHQKDYRVVVLSEFFVAVGIHFLIVLVLILLK